MATNMRTRAQAIEMFHLAFLQVLHTRMDPSRYVLKGGANLRYFFHSVRYSEDIDLDLAGAEPWVVTQKVGELLESPALTIILRAAELEVATITDPKQTETTQRWKVSIRAPGHDDPVRTKIEFSNRNGDDRYELEAVPQSVLGDYPLRPPSVQHYTVAAAVEQKTRALAGRSETQARDVFDLDLLLRSHQPSPGDVDRSILKEAAERAVGLPFGAFRDQVLPFLEADVADLYDEAAWDQMQLSVVEKLGVSSGGSG